MLKENKGKVESKGTLLVHHYLQDETLNMLKSTKTITEIKNRKRKN